MSKLNLHKDLSTLYKNNEKFISQKNYVQKDNFNLPQIKTIFPDSIDQTKIKFHSLKDSINKIDLIYIKDVIINV